MFRDSRSLFTDVPRRHRGTVHEVNVGNAKPIKQHPYRINPEKTKAMRKEVEYLLENDLAEVSDSEWSSPCPLVLLNKMRHANQRLTRWCLQLQEYNLEIRHIKGRDNVVADALLRV